jgi:hypothetical protein
MSPKPGDDDSGSEDDEFDDMTLYKEGNDNLVENAGTVKLAESQAWGKGVVADVQRTVGTHWVSEMINFNQKTVAVSCLIFISIIPPTLAFGASYGKMSNQRIGAIETILATSWVGVAYSLIGGMPMCIIGSTGPALALSTAVKNIAARVKSSLASHSGAQTLGATRTATWGPRLFSTPS